MIVIAVIALAPIFIAYFDKCFVKHDNYHLLKIKLEFDGGIYENNYIQNMAMHLGDIANIPGIDYVHNAL